MSKSAFGNAIETLVHLGFQVAVELERKQQLDLEEMDVRRRRSSFPWPDVEKMPLVMRQKLAKSFYDLGLHQTVAALDPGITSFTTPASEASDAKAAPAHPHQEYQDQLGAMEPVLKETGYLISKDSLVIAIHYDALPDPLKRQVEDLMAKLSYGPKDDATKPTSGLALDHAEHLLVGGRSGARLRPGAGEPGGVGCDGRLEPAIRGVPGAAVPRGRKDAGGDASCRACRLERGAHHPLPLHPADDPGVALDLPERPRAVDDFASRQPERVALVDEALALVDPAHELALVPGQGHQHRSQLLLGILGPYGHAGGAAVLCSLAVRWAAAGALFDDVGDGAGDNLESLAPLFLGLWLHPHGIACFWQVEDRGKDRCF